MNNWGLLRFAGKPYCLTGVSLCYGGCLGGIQIFHYARIGNLLLRDCLKNFELSVNSKQTIKTKKYASESRGRERALIIHYSFFIFH